MQIFFEGASNPTHRNRLVEAGARAVSYSWSSLIPRLPENKPYIIAEHLPDEVEAIIHGGTVDPDGDDHAYHTFIANNINRLSLAIEIDHDDYDRVQENRVEFWDFVPDNKACPVWRPEHGEEALEELARNYSWIAIGERHLYDDGVKRLLRNLTARTTVGIHALGTARVAEIPSMPVDAVNTSSWLSPERHGELIVWTGQRLRRYNRKYFERGVKRHGHILEQHGFDISKVREKDAETLCQVAVWSYLEFEKSVLATIAGQNSEEGTTESDDNRPAIGGRNVPSKTEPREGEPQLLPIFEIRDEEEPEYDDLGQQVGTTMVPRARVSERNLMQCDTCYLASKCPKFKPGNDCAFEIPASLKTTDDLNQVMSALLEIQSQRAFFARFGEMLDGGYPDPVVSSEMDRFFKLTEKMKDINDSRDTFEMQVRAKSSAGVLSRIFGEKAGEAQKQLSGPLEATEVIREIEG